MTWLKRFKQWRCAHVCFLDDLRRVSPERVECPCNRCGKLLVAPYGLAMHCKFERSSPGNYMPPLADIAGE